MMQVLLCAALGLMPAQDKTCENMGVKQVDARAEEGRDLGCGHCPLWSIFTPAHAEKSPQTGRRIVGSTELPVLLITRHCEIRGMGLFEFFEPDVCVPSSPINLGIVTHYRDEKC